MNRKSVSPRYNMRSDNGPAVMMAKKQVHNASGNQQQLAAKRLDDNLQKVKSQVGQLMEQARINVTKQKGAKKPADLEKAKALEELVKGVNQVISSLEKLR